MPLDQAKEYLARVLPWPQEGDEPAFACIQWTFKTDEQEKPGWGGRACRSVSEAANAIEWALKQNGTRDIYVCMSTQREAVEKIAKNGGKFYTPKRSQDNAVALKSLFLDIDAKGTDKNSYDSLDQAVSALAKFLKDAQLPKPSLIVASGGGLHVYWTMSRALTPTEWRPLAYALAEATRRHGLKCDTQVTIDHARILRVPDTLNRKSDPPRPVILTSHRTDFDYLPERLAEALEPYKVETPQISQKFILDPTALPPRKPLREESDLSAGIEKRAANPININDVAAECAFIREALDTGGKNYSNPLWMLTTLISVFTTGGRADAHAMANKHADYKPETTDELFDRKVREHEEKGIGWPSCASIRGAGCGACATCPHFAAGKSPLHHARKQTVTPVVTPATAPGQATDLPVGYSRRADGVILKDVTQDDGTIIKVPIFRYPMTNPWLQADPWILNFETVCDKPRRIALQTDIIPTPELRKHLGAQGVLVHANELRPLMEFLVSWVQQLQQNKQVVSSVPFGWSLKGGRIEGFCFGGNVWMPNNQSRRAANPSPVTGQHYEPSGELQPWLDAAKMITDQGRPDINAILASSFAAPLVRFTGQSGLLMSAYSIESGIGKSTALKVAQSVWGDPVKAMQGLTDTQLSVLNKIGEIKNLPLYWDELKTEDDTRRFVNLAFQLSLGKERSRLTQSVQQRQPGTWQTLLVSASNESLLDFIVSRTRMTTAGLYRVFEYEVRPGTKGQIDATDAQRIIAKLHDHYGHAGLIYSKFLGSEYVRIDKEVGQCLKQINTEVSGQADERFWIALIATILMGARYANELKLTQIDEPSLKEFMLTCLGNMREERNKQPVDMRDVMNVSNILAQYLNAMRARHTVYTNRIHLGRGKPPKGTITLARAHNNLDAVYVHVGVEDKLLRISSTHLSEWLADKGYSRHLFTKALQDEMGMNVIRGRIGGGTEYVGATEYLLEINLAGTPMANFIDED